MPNDRAVDPVLLTAIDEGIALVTLNRPRQYNALSAQMLAALHEALDALAADAAVRVVMITGAGSAFCAGHDLREMRGLAPDAARALFEACSSAMRKLLALPQPVIAVVNGLATAAGCQLVAQCDLAVASAHARFAASGVNLGLFCSTPAVALSRNLGRKRAAEMLFTGEFIDAGQAEEWGLVNRVAPPDQLMETARALAATMMAKPAEALALGKALFYRQLEQPLAPAYDDASRTIAANLEAGYAREGVDAFLAKRAPGWRR